ncbi:hypothetical protein [Ekhidna sp.]|uniref:hypothetical protein n=1 Tax=Ekhidna sp. TaxID=2608089 RepID=UPI0032EE928B
MKQLFITIFLLSLSSNLAFGQTNYDSPYEDGLYKTKEDLISKKPSSQVEIYPVINGKEYDESLDEVNECFFYYRDSEKKIKNTFAISYDGNLFFQKVQIVMPKNRNKKDKDQSMYTYNAFVKVIEGGDNYLYTELELHSGWGAAVAANTSVKSAGNETLKGVVWDFKNEEFNIFRNCKDLNEFMELIFPDGKQNCDSKAYDIEMIRKNISVIK